MAKGLRSNSKRRYRTLKRESVVKAPWQKEAEEKRQEALAAVLAAPKPSEVAGEGGDGAGPAAMEVLQAGGDAAVPMDDRPAGASLNPTKLKNKLRKQRLAATQGIVKGISKKSKPLAGPNQFHKKKKKR